jgi:hypothetical protein
MQKKAVKRSHSCEWAIPRNCFWGSPLAGRWWRKESVRHRDVTHRSFRVDVETLVSVITTNILGVNNDWRQTRQIEVDSRLDKPHCVYAIPVTVM